MSASNSDRTDQALAAIKEIYGTEEGEFSVNLFVAHHLESLDKEYWKKHTQTANPSPEQVLDILVLQSHWSDEEEEEEEENDDEDSNYDFSLPDEVTNYVICVQFDPFGKIEGISMES